MEILNKVKSKFLPNGTFGRSVLVLVSGTTLAQATPVLISPILTRIYNPDDFGVLAIFVAMTTILGAVANGRYDWAIILPERDEDAYNVAAFGVFLAGCFASLLFVVVCFFGDQLANLLQSAEIRNWLYVVPLVVFVLGIFNCLNYMNNRFKQYKTIAGASVLRAIVSAGVQLGIGLIKPGVHGLIFGQIASQFTAIGRMSAHVTNKKELVKSVNWSKMKELGKRYVDFPKYSLWGTLANTLSQNLLNFVLSVLYSLSTLGFYTLVNRILGMPTVLVGSAIGQVFLRTAVEEKNRTGQASRIFLKTLFVLFVISFPCFVLLYFWIEDVVAFVFGQSWRVAGEYAQVMIPLFFIRFLTAPLSNLNTIFEKQKVTLLWQIGLLLWVLIDFVLAKGLHLEILEYLQVVTWTLVVHYVLLLVILYRVSIGTEKEKGGKAE